MVVFISSRLLLTTLDCTLTSYYHQNNNWYHCFFHCYNHFHFITCCLSAYFSLVNGYFNIFQKMVYLQYLYTRQSQHKGPQNLLNLKNLKRILKKAHHRYHQQPPLELQNYPMTHLRESDDIHQAQAFHKVQDHL